MSNNTMTITEILSLAKIEWIEVYGLAMVTRCPSTGRYHVDHDYGNCNFSSWETHEEARQEAARLWLTGEVSKIDDHVVRQVEKETSARVEQFEDRMTEEADRIKAELRAA
jgi:hypothetical protein